MTDLTGIVTDPGSSKEYQTGSWRQGQRPKWDKQKCRQCLICFHHCPEACFQLKGDKIVGLDLSFCKGCGQCQEVCPFNAIEMEVEE